MRKIIKVFMFNVCYFIHLNTALLYKGQLASLVGGLLGWWQHAVQIVTGESYRHVGD
jgi:hypothetical protein